MSTLSENKGHTESTYNTEIFLFNLRKIDEYEETNDDAADAVGGADDDF